MIKFFCGGPIKSGTTFLQRLLDSHPKVICPPEVVLNDLLSDLLNCQKRHNLRSIRNAETFGIEPKIASEEIFIEGFYKIIDRFMSAKEENTEAFGINDNHFLIYNAKSILDYFKKSKIIYIVRNPFDTGLSTWDHFLKLYKKTKNPAFLNNIGLNKVLDKNKFLINNAKEWNEIINVLLKNLKENPKRIIILKYENLCLKTPQEIRKIFNFLEIEITNPMLKKITKESSLSFMKAKSSNPDFYSHGRLDFGIGKIDEKNINKINEITKGNLSLLGYSFEEKKLMFPS